MNHIKAKVFPAPGKVVIDPATGRALPESGSTVIVNQYWRRRLKDGDIVNKPARSAKPKSTSKTTK